MLGEVLLRAAILIVLQIVVYVGFLRSRILAWGATATEVTMSLPGDDLAPFISATRAITIDAPQVAVWRGIIQLGADRGGFYSYGLIEKALGYQAREADSLPAPTDMPVGRIVPGSLNEARSVIKYNFPVVAVDPGTSFVLGGWGTFALRATGPAQTRLLVRTHGQHAATLPGRAVDLILVAAHYIMERRMLMGLKAQIETGERLSAAPDNLWLLGLMLSGIGIAAVLLTSGVAAMLLALGYGVVWLWTLLLANPRSLSSVMLAGLITVTLLWLV